MSAAAIAVVTGPSRGIGRATALALVRRGLGVALLGRPTEQLDEVAAEVEGLGGLGRIVPCDVSRPSDVEAAAQRVLRDMGAPVVVVNNAGIVRRGWQVETTPVDVWDEVLTVNLRGPFLVSRAFLPAMKAAGRGRLVHVGSVSSTIGCPSNASYAASKWGLSGFAKSLAEELRGTGVISVVVLPGSVDTRMLEGSGFEPAMTAEDVAGTIAYLALDAPAAIHGSAVELFG